MRLTSFYSSGDIEKSREDPRNLYNKDIVVENLVKFVEDNQSFDRNTGPDCRQTGLEVDNRNRNENRSHITHKSMFDSKMDKLDQKVTLLNLIVEDLEFQFSKRLVDHPNNSRLKDIKGKYNGIIRNTDLFYYTYAIEDDRIHHESRYGNDFRETDYSLNFNDTSGTYHVRECSHGVEELDKDFINETDEENGEESSEEEMIEVVNQKVIEADIVLKNQ
ncbi:hypothetical protein Tco_1099598 [Tanacetum coccineum]